ncbi:Gamma-secretase subunit APH1-like [Tetrabaena socialis]|uniref:Gamma-secretase subunit APH1-like n=1 Tax=Tetrabaena socialis TaxID=47790 RepID=A0A2J8AC32_9CHLO|nr:Gamma-secretase subunit APH1-like [Tetrabaena socialis]|eukprot:PNH10066.1 Gamma-secretase subunit APH1-like [Tetrabaena socialis]
MPIDFFGLIFLGLGPGIAFFIVVIARKSFLVLLSLFSAFLWLIVLLFTSAIFRGFLPVAEQTGSYAGVLAASVVIQECVRYGVWRAHRKTVETLETMARASGHRFTLLDRLYMALAWGYGHGATHCVFFFLSLLPLTASKGTYYIDACPQMSIFMVAALYSLAFGTILACLMVIAFDGYMSRSPALVLGVAAVHMGASMLTLLNFQANGCIAAMPALLGLGLLLVAYTVGLCWRKGGR